ncbi:MAG: rhodanese-like domain-containing protein [Desulfobacterales bacterium]|jgi:sulfur-carrier protein adenylyltransferase/sulfurtransferase
MRWKQFFTPVESIDAPQAKSYRAAKTPEEYTFLDVRQPGEYQSGHIPGAKLIPLPDLNDRLGEIDANKPTIVYCASGGRSRVAAQMLVGKGFNGVYNLTGGFKAWKSERAIGAEDLGLDLFTGRESPEETLVVAYSMEEGLREFYLSMIPWVKSESARDLFDKLSAIEVKHQDRIFDEYRRMTGAGIDRGQFVKTVVTPAVEGGLTTGEYVRLYKPDLESVADIIGLAMAIEAQALDLYRRAADRSSNPQSRQMLMRIADEEQAHLAQLGELFDRI